MPGNIFSFSFVVEGKGEVEAIPLLIRRICNEICSFFTLKTTRPVRITKSKLVRPGELERAIQLAQMANEARGAVLVVIDADEDCPAELGRSLKSRACAVAQPDSVSIILPKYEFETWFLTAAQSLSGLRGLREGLVPPPSPEAIRGAKEWLDNNMAAPDGRYSPSVDQAALAARMDLTAARSCKSFDRLCREIQRLLVSC